MAINLDDNPFKPPSIQLTPSRSYWQRLIKLVHGWLDLFRERDFSSTFLDGNPVFQYGVLFQIDPQLPNLIMAYLPLAELDQRRIELNINEAVREMNKLIAQHSELACELANRDLKVCLVPNYQETHNIICDKLVTDWYNEFDIVEHENES